MVKPANLTIALKPAAIAKFGATRAVILQQLREFPKWQPDRLTNDGWFEASSEDLAEITGLTAPTCRQQIPKLMAEGLIDKREQITTHGQGKNGYRVTVDEHGNPLDPGPTQTSKPGPSETSKPGPTETSKPTYVPDDESGDNPPTPQGGNDGPPKLFDDQDPGGGCDSPAEKKRAARRGRGVSAINAEYHKAWRRDEYPSGKIGSNAKSETAFVRALKRGDTIGDLNRRTRNYVAARELYLETVGEEAPLLHASTFLGSRSLDWDQPWTVDGPEFSLEASSWPTRKRKAAPVSSDDMLADAQAKWEAEQLAEMRGQNGQDGRNV